MRCGHEASTCEFQESVSRPAYSTRLGRVAAGQGLDELSEAHRVAVAPASLADSTVEAPLVSEWAQRLAWMVDVGGGQVVDWTRSSNEGSWLSQGFSESAAIMQACVEQASAALALGMCAASQVQSQRRL